MRDLSNFAASIALGERRASILKKEWGDSLYIITKAHNTKKILQKKKKKKKKSQKKEMNEDAEYSEYCAGRLKQRVLPGESYLVCGDVGNGRLTYFHPSEQKKRRTLLQIRKLEPHIAKRFGTSILLSPEEFLTRNKSIFLYGTEGGRDPLFLYTLEGSDNSSEISHQSISLHSTDKAQGLGTAFRVNKDLLKLACGIGKNEANICHVNLPTKNLDFYKTISCPEKIMAMSFDKKAEKLVVLCGGDIEKVVKIYVAYLLKANAQMEEQQITYKFMPVNVTGVGE